MTHISTPGQCRSFSNGNERLFHIRQFFRIGVSPLEEVYVISSRLDTCFGDMTPPGGIQSTEGIYVFGTDSELLLYFTCENILIDGVSPGCNG